MTERRLLLTLLALALPGLLWLRFAQAQGSTLPFDLEPIEATLGEFTPEEHVPFPPDVIAQIEPDVYRNRRYVTESGDALHLYLAFYSGGLVVGAHDPAVCYPAQGWEVSDTWEVDVPTPDGSLRARVLRAANGSREELVLYWFQPARRWPGTAALEQVHRVADALQGRPQYAFVRLSARLDPDRDPGPRLAQFASEIAPRVRAILEVPAPESGGAPAGDHRRDRRGQDLQVELK